MFRPIAPISLKLLSQCSTGASLLGHRHHGLELQYCQIITRKANLSQTRPSTTLSRQKITEILSQNEVNIVPPKVILPSCIRSIECNQLASNDPIEDRVRVSSLMLPGDTEPTLIVGVFDGHGGGTTADLVSSRLFKYIAVSLTQELSVKLDDLKDLDGMLYDIHCSPDIRDRLSALHDFIPNIRASESVSLGAFKQKYESHEKKRCIASALKSAFKQCDDDLSTEIQSFLDKPGDPRSSNFYRMAAISGCCAIVMVLHRGVGYVASAGDCRAVLGQHDKQCSRHKITNVSSRDDDKPMHTFNAIELNSEHNCDNIHEIRRLATAHPNSEQNTMIKHNRLLGHLMPFRAFGDFNYKWTPDVIRACGMTRAFGSSIIPSHYLTPPYLIADPDVSEIQLNDDKANELSVVLATDGLWEMFESSRDVIETLLDHAENANLTDFEDEYDPNCATYIIRSALRSTYQLEQRNMDAEERKRLQHLRLEATLTLPKGLVRNFRDDISLIVLKLQ